MIAKRSNNPRSCVDASVIPRTAGKDARATVVRASLAFVAFGEAGLPGFRHDSSESRRTRTLRAMMQKLRRQQDFKHGAAFRVIPAGKLAAEGLDEAAGD